MLSSEILEDVCNGKGLGLSPIRREATSRDGAVRPQNRHLPPEGALTQEKFGSPHSLRTANVSFLRFFL